jgi:cobalt-zinc-cadmium efflux system protein
VTPPPHELRRSRRLWLALGLNVAITVVQLVAGFAAHSLGLLSDAAHNFTDVAAIALSLVALQWTWRRPTAKRSFGYHRGTILAALTNGVTILIVSVLITIEGVRRLAHPEAVSGGIVLVVALAGALVNGVAAVALREPHAGHDHEPETTDLNLRSAMLHLGSDALASLGVAIAGAVILVTGSYERLDPIVSIAIAALIAWQAVRLLRDAVDVLLESTPGDVDLASLAAAIGATPGVETVHDLHVWSLSTHVRAMSAHVVLEGDPSLREAQAIGHQIKAMVASRFAIAHATLEIESVACLMHPEECAIDELPHQSRSH